MHECIHSLLLHFEFKTKDKEQANEIDGGILDMLSLQILSQRNEACISSCGGKVSNFFDRGILVILLVFQLGELST
jgi:hypothetical protein